MARAYLALVVAAFVAGTSLLPSGIARLLGGAIPFVTFLTTLALIPSERPNRVMGLGVLFGFVGIVLTAGPWENGQTISLTGVFWVLAGAISVGV